MTEKLGKTIHEPDAVPVVGLRAVVQQIYF